jgi:hypothetical protein
VKDWRVAGTETIAAVLDKKSTAGWSRSVIVRPDETFILLKNGQIQGVFTAGKFPTRSFSDLLRWLIGKGPDTQCIFADTSSATLAFWLEDPAFPADSVNGESLGIPVLTKDRQVVGGQVTLRVSIDPHGDPELLLRMLRGKSLLTTVDLQHQIRHELLGRVLQLELAQHDAADLRGNEQLLRDLDQQSKAELERTMTGYGLRLESFDISWALSEEESQQLEKRRHEYQIERSQRDSEIRKINSTFSSNPDTEITIGGDYRVQTTSGIHGPWLAAILLVTLIGFVSVVYLLEGR